MHQLTVERDALAVKIQQREGRSFFSELRRLARAAAASNGNTAASAATRTVAIKARSTQPFSDNERY
jgi:hypothetical protein